MNQKRCLTIQDYSCMGRCSLTVALPILSACGIETIGLPTAILSNHTAFSSWTYVDLTAEMEKSIDKWKDYDHHFDSFYTGYLNRSDSCCHRYYQKAENKGFLCHDRSRIRRRRKDVPWI